MASPAAKAWMRTSPTSDRSGSWQNARPVNAKTRERGFTLLEMIMVVVLIAAICGLTVGLLGVGRQGRQLRAAVRTVATELRYTRTRALTTGVSQRFVMDLDTRQWIAADHHGTLPASMQVSFNAV